MNSKVFMSYGTMIHKRGKHIRNFLWLLLISFVLILGVFNKIIIPLTLIEYEITLANSAPGAM